MKSKLTQDVNESISEDAITSLLHANNEDFSFVRDSVITAVNTVMSSEIPSEKLAEAKEKSQRAEKRFRAVKVFVSGN